MNFHSKKSKLGLALVAFFLILVGRALPRTDNPGSVRGEATTVHASVASTSMQASPDVSPLPSTTVPEAIIPSPSPSPSLQPSPTVKPTPKPTPIKTPTPIPTPNAGLSNDNTYTNTAGNTVHSPAYTQDNSVPAGASAQCGDGTYSFSQSRSGTCSHHGGVSRWL